MTVTENTNNDYTYTISESTEALNAKSSNLAILSQRYGRQHLQGLERYTYAHSDGCLMRQYISLRLDAPAASALRLLAMQ